MSAKNKHLKLTIAIGDASFHAAGNSDLVMAALDEFKTLSVTPPGPPATKLGDPSGAAGGKVVPGSGGPPVRDAKVPFGLFMQREFANQHAMATAIMTWAKRYDGKDQLKPSEVETYWKKVAKKPGNVTQVCLNAEKPGWVDNVGGAYAVTGHGEMMVDSLPPKPSPTA